MTKLDKTLLLISGVWFVVFSIMGLFPPRGVDLLTSLLLAGLVFLAFQLGMWHGVEATKDALGDTDRRRPPKGNTQQTPTG